VTPRRALPLWIGAHVLVSGAVAALFAWRFDQDVQAVVGHMLLIAAWDVAIGAIAIACASWFAFCAVLIVTSTLQVYLYALDAVSNLSWGRNITGHLVSAFAGTVWSGQERFPLGQPGIVMIALGTLMVVALIVALPARLTGNAIAPWAPRSPRAGGALAIAVLMSVLAGVTINRGIEARESRIWKDELLVSFFRPNGYAFEPTARRHAIAERDAVLRAAYPRGVAGARRTNVILVIVDSLRADHMQAYGYARPTTPFLSQLVSTGRMKRVENAFSTCSESFCGITSTLSSREFRDISAPTFDLQDALRDEGYRTWFLLSGNHTAWNGLPDFYHASDDTYFDGSDTQRYTMDDDRLVLEGLERVPPASPEQPAFFYVHLMSTHYLGVQFPESHVFTQPGEMPGEGDEPYSVLVQHLDTPDHYDDKVLQADGMIRRLFDAFAAKHYLDDAIVVVIGDHGEGLGERHFAHGWDLYNEDIRIPMLLYDTSRARYPDLSFAAQVDVAPTIVDRLGLPIPASWEGQSLLSPSPARFTYHQTYFLPNRFGVLYRNGPRLYKFISTPEYGKEELYDLVRDRTESHNIAADNPSLAAVLRAKVRAYRDDN
jgi:glucan phosphoethanolaminetransferase (alkaline phosphatase superfamily)